MTHEEAIAFKEKHRIRYNTEVSAKTGRGVKELVEHIAKNLYHINKENLTNFKSFEGHHIIGPYLRFTAVVGPNGGGKLVKVTYKCNREVQHLGCHHFVLMLSHISKKHKHIKELIYREEQERYNENKREMSVTLNFSMTS